MIYNNNWLSIVLEIRKIILESNSQIEEKIMCGGIMFTIENTNICGIYLSKTHVSLEFSKGYLLEDKNKILEGVGHTRRRIKIPSFDDIKFKKYCGFCSSASSG